MDSGSSVSIQIYLVILAVCRSGVLACPAVRPVVSVLGEHCSCVAVWSVCPLSDALTLGTCIITESSDELILRNSRHPTVFCLIYFI